MHKPLAHPVQFGVSGIMPGAVQGKQRVHAAVPVAHTAAAVSAIFILDVKAPAGRTHIGTGAAVDTGKRNFFPEGSVVEFVGLDSPEIVGFHKCRYFIFGSFLFNFNFL